MLGRIFFAWSGAHTHLGAINAENLRKAHALLEAAAPKAKSCWRGSRAGDECGLACILRSSAVAIRPRRIHGKAA